MNRGSDHAARGVLDPRLSRYAHATRLFLAGSVALGLLSAALIVVQAWLLAYVVAGAFGGDGLAQLTPELSALLGVVIARGLLAWGAELIAGRCSVRAKQQLRAALLARVAALGPGRMGEQRTAEVATLATRGIDALDGYFSLYLPQLTLAVLVPVAILAVLLARDWVSALIIAATLPLIPVFMALVGATTRERTEARLRALQRLGAHFLDVVAGLATLKVFGRAKAQIGVIGDVAEHERGVAMSTLKVTFLSSLVLEVLATISVALVAVAVGLRLLAGDLSLQTALFVLVVAPEAYLPLRLLGERYHASAEGVAAARQAFEVLETPLPPRGRLTAIPDLSTAVISIDQVTVVYPRRDRPALGAVSLEIDPGEGVAVAGPSGSGKSTLVSILLGFVVPDSGSVRIGPRRLSELDPEAWRRRIAWLPQRPHLFAGSIGENVRMSRPEATDDEVWQAIKAAGLVEVVRSRRGGLDALVGEHGRGISAGERRRVALARVFLRDAPLLLLDEPTANLDAETEEQVVAAIRRLMESRTVILATHSPAVWDLADRVIELGRVAVAA